MRSGQVWCRWLVLVLLSASLFACHRGNYTRSVYGTKGGYSLKHTTPRPPSLLVARKVARPLYIVLDPKQVKDTYALATEGCQAPELDDVQKCEYFKLFDVQTFVRRDLKLAMQHYFSSVEVVRAGEPLPDRPHIFANVKVDGFGLRTIYKGGVAHTIIEMTWAFAMRPGEEKDYAFSFAGVARSSDTYATFEAGCTTLIEAAITMLVDKWSKHQGLQSG